MAHLRLSSLDRTLPLSDAEMVRLGRLLIPRLGVTHLAFPDDAARTTVLVPYVFGEGLPELVGKGVAEVLGEFDLTTFSEWEARPSHRLVTADMPGITDREVPSEPMVHLFAPGRGATVLGAFVLNDEGGGPGADAPGVFRVRFPGLPLPLWERTVGAGVAKDADRDGVGYEVVGWNLGGELLAPTGAPLREIYATLRQVTIAYRADFG